MKDHPGITPDPAGLGKALALVRRAGADILPHAAFSATGGPGTYPCLFHLAPGFVVWSGVMRRHLPSFGRGWTTRSYSNEVSPDLSTFRTVFRDTFRSRAISLIVFPCAVAGLGRAFVRFRFGSNRGWAWLALAKDSQIRTKTEHRGKPFAAGTVQPQRVPEAAH